MGIAIGTGETRRMTNADPQFKRLTKVEEEANLQKAEQEAKRKKDDEERRAKEDEMIEQIERGFHANRAAMVDGTAKMVEGERRRGPGIPVAAPVSLDSLINEDDLDRLLQYFEDGNEIVLEPREKIEAVADDDTLKKAQKMVELLTQTMHQGKEKMANRTAERKQRVQSEQDAIARGEECELAKMLKEKLAAENAAAVESHPGMEEIANERVESGLKAAQEMARREVEAEVAKRALLEVAREEVADASSQHEEHRTEGGLAAPKYEIEIEEEAGQDVGVVVRVELPLVKSSRDNEASVVDSQVLELFVEGLYSLRASLPLRCIDEDEMSCRYDKKSKVLTVHLRCTK